MDIRATLVLELIDTDDQLVASASATGQRLIAVESDNAAVALSATEGTIANVLIGVENRAVAGLLAAHPAAVKKES